MFRELRTNLIWKTALACIVGILIVQLAVFWPEASRRKRAARLQVSSELRAVARVDAEVKAQALAQGRGESLKSRLPFWKASRFPSAAALVDRNGATKTSSDAAPDFSQGDWKERLDKAFARGMQTGALEGWRFAIEPLSVQGEMRTGDQPVGAFIALANDRAAIRAVTQRGALGDAMMMLLAAAFATPLFLLICYLLFIKPIRLIERHDRMLDMESGRYVSIPDSQIALDELGNVGRGRNRLMERLKETQTLVRETNAMLERAEAKYRALVQSLPDIVFRFDPNGQIVFLSPSFERLLGVKPESVYENNEAFFSRVHADDRATLQQALSAIVKGEKNRSVQFRMLAPRSVDPPLVFTLSYSSLIDSQGHNQGIEGVLRRVLTPDMLAPEADEHETFAALNDVSRALHSGPLQEDVFDYLSIKAAELAGAERSVLALVDEDVCLAIGTHQMAEEIKQSVLPLQDTAEAKVIETREPLLLLNEDAWNTYGLAGPYVGVPVLDRLGQPVGLICCLGLRVDIESKTVMALRLYADLISPTLESERALRVAARKQAEEESRPKKERRKRPQDVTFFEQDV